MGGSNLTHTHSNYPKYKFSSTYTLTFPQDTCMHTHTNACRHINTHTHTHSHILYYFIMLPIIAIHGGLHVLLQALVEHLTDLDASWKS